MGADPSTDALSMYQPLKEARCHATFVAGAITWCTSEFELFTYTNVPECAARLKFPANEPLSHRSA